MKDRTYIRVRATVSTVKKSQASTPAVWREGTRPMPARFARGQARSHGDGGCRARRWLTPSPRLGPLASDPQVAPAGVLSAARPARRVQDRPVHLLGAMNVLGSSPVFRVHILRVPS